MKKAGNEEDDMNERAITRAQTFASLRPRLSMQTNAEAEPNGHAEKAIVEKRAEDLESNMMERPPGLQHRQSTIKWTMPATPDQAHIPSAEPSPNTSVPDLLNRTAEGEVGGPQTGQRVERPREESSPRRNLLRRLSAKMASEPAKSPV
jgi:hypothetical protein